MKYSVFNFIFICVCNSLLFKFCSNIFLFLKDIIEVYSVVLRLYFCKKLMKFDLDLICIVLKSLCHMKIVCKNFKPFVFVICFYRLNIKVFFYILKEKFFCLKLCFVYVLFSEDVLEDGNEEKEGIGEVESEQSTTTNYVRRRSFKKPKGFFYIGGSNGAHLYVILHTYIC